MAQAFESGQEGDELASYGYDVRIEDFAFDASGFRPSRVDISRSDSIPAFARNPRLRLCALLAASISDNTASRRASSSSSIRSRSRAC